VNTGDFQTPQSSIVEEYVLPLRPRVRQPATGQFLAVRKDINEYVETESAWKQYALNS
jgi:hypothetical protein